MGSHAVVHAVVSVFVYAVSCGGLCGLNGGPCDGLCGLMRWSMRWSVCLSVLLSVCFCLCFCLCFVCASVCVLCLCWLCSALAARTVQKLFAFRVVWAPTHVRALDPLAYERGPECARACTHVGTAEAGCDVGWHRASLWQPGWGPTRQCITRSGKIEDTQGQQRYMAISWTARPGCLNNLL